MLSAPWQVADAVQVAQESVRVPQSFLCPITQEIMADPVMTVDGQVYERTAINEWLRRGNNTSPLTALVLPSLVLTPERPLKRAIEEYLVARPELERKELDIQSLQAAAHMLEQELQFKFSNPQASEESHDIVLGESLLDVMRDGDAKQALKLLDGLGRFEVNRKDAQGRSALHFAAKRGLSHVAFAILSHPDFTEGLGEARLEDGSRTAAEIALANGHEGLASALAAYSEVMGRRTPGASNPTESIGSSSAMAPKTRILVEQWIKDEVKHTFTTASTETRKTKHLAKVIRGCKEQQLAVLVLTRSAHVENLVWDLQHLEEDMEYVAGFHAGMSSSQRESALQEFPSNTKSCLICDPSIGLHKFPSVRRLIHYQVPARVDDYFGRLANIAYSRPVHCWAILSRDSREDFAFAKSFVSFLDSHRTALLPSSAPQPSLLKAACWLTKFCSSSTYECNGEEASWVDSTDDKGKGKDKGKAKGENGGMRMQKGEAKGKGSHSRHGHSLYADTWRESTWDTWPSSASTGNQLARQRKHRQPLIQAPQAQATS
jgi:hypothetical protein